MSELSFRFLKIKLGHDIDVDLERLIKLREKFGNNIVIRVDANQGYSIEDTLHLFNETKSLNLELIEQPVTVELFERLKRLPEKYRDLLCADESLQDVNDAKRITAYDKLCKIFNRRSCKAQTF